MTNAAAFNGGRSQINPNFLGEGADFAMMNVMKEAQNWNFQGDGSWPGPDIVDSNGYITTLDQGSVRTYLQIPPQSYRPGNYVVLWTCTGSSTIGFIDSNYGSTLVAGSDSQTDAADGRAVYSFPSDATGSCTFSINDMSGGYITSIAIVHADDETAYNDGAIFGVQFLERLTTANFGVVRFLNWTLVNSSIQTTWDSRMPVDHFSYAAYRWDPDRWAGTTTNSGLDYSITFGSGAPTDKQTIHVEFNAEGVTNPLTGSITASSPGVVTVPGGHGLSVGDVISIYKTSTNLPPEIDDSINYYVLNDGNFSSTTFDFATSADGTAINTSVAVADLGIVRLPTLNLNSEGAVVIRANTGGAFIETIPTLVNTLVYDTDFNAWLFQFNGISTLSCPMLVGAPPEICVELCSQIGAHPWFPAPMYAMSPMGATTSVDWTTQLATYIKGNAPSWMVPRFETWNEIFNSIQPVTVYCWYKSFIYWGSIIGQFGQDQLVGKVGSTMGQAVNAVYGGNVDGTLYNTIVSFQSETFADTVSTSNERMTAATYVANGPSQSGYTESPASDWCTHICYANYFSPSIESGDSPSGEEVTLAQAYAAASPGAEQLAIATEYALYSVTGINGVNGVTGYPLEQLQVYATNAATFASNFTTNDNVTVKVCAYEGGYSPDTTATGDNATIVNNLRYASKLVEDIGTMIIGGTLSNGIWVNGLYWDYTQAGCVFPSCFQLSGNGDAWSVISPNVYATPTYEYNAIIEFNVNQQTRVNVNTTISGSS